VRERAGRTAPRGFAAQASVPFSRIRNIYTGVPTGPARNLYRVSTYNHCNHATYSCRPAQKPALHRSCPACYRTTAAFLPLDSSIRSGAGRELLSFFLFFKAWRNARAYRPGATQIRQKPGEPLSRVKFNRVVPSPPHCPHLRFFLMRHFAKSVAGTRASQVVLFKPTILMVRPWGGLLSLAPPQLTGFEVRHKRSPLEGEVRARRAGGGYCRRPFPVL